jgi:hypothetical protein
VQVLHDYTGEARRRWLRVFRYTRTMLVCAVLFLAGIGLAGSLVVEYVHSGLTLRASQTRVTYLAVTGLLLVVASFMTFTATLLIHAAALRSPGADGRSQ